MKQHIAGKLEVKEYKKVYAGRADNEKGTILFTDIPMFNLTIGTICPSCGQGLIVREIDDRDYKDFVCTHCGISQSVYEDCSGIF